MSYSDPMPHAATSPSEWINRPPITVEITERGFQWAINAIKTRAAITRGTATPSQIDFLDTLTGAGYGKDRLLYVFRDATGVAAIMKVWVKADFVEVMKLASVGGGGGAALLAFALGVRPRIELNPLEGAKPYYRNLGFVASTKTRGYMSLDPTKAPGSAYWMFAEKRWKRVPAAPRS